MEKTAMLSITIDGIIYPARKGSTILEVAKEQDIYIPTLCYHEELSPGGRCRLCTVEIISPKLKQPLVLACVRKVVKGMEVRSQSEKISARRKKAMRSIFGRAPQAEKIQQMAREIGLEVDPSQMGGTGCIDCGICVRACKEIVGRSAIRFKKRHSASKGEEPSVEALTEKCIGCGTCAYLCPTGFIKMKDCGEVRIIWDKIFRRKRQFISADSVVPHDYIRHLKKTEGIETECFNELSEPCRQKDKSGQKI